MAEFTFQSIPFVVGSARHFLFFFLILHLLGELVYEGERTTLGSLLSVLLSSFLPPCLSQG